MANYFSEMFRRMGPVTKNLLIINVLVWLFCQLAPYTTVNTLLDYGALHYFDSPGFKVWQPITYMFIHTEFYHLFFNMFALFMFGTMIEWALGRERYLFFYISCGLGAALIQEGVFAVMLSKYHSIFTPEQYDVIVNQFWYALHHGGQVYGTLQELALLQEPAANTIGMIVNGPTIGASGAIYGILLAFGMLWPNRELYIMFIPVPVKAKWVVVGYVVIELAMGLGQIADNVAHFAHLGGMAVGFVILWYWKKKGLFRGWY